MFSIRVCPVRRVRVGQRRSFALADDRLPFCQLLAVGMVQMESATALATHTDRGQPDTVAAARLEADLQRAADFG